MTYLGEQYFVGLWLLLEAELDALELLPLPAFVTFLHTGRIDQGASGTCAALRVVGIGDVLAANDFVNDFHTIGGGLGTADTVDVSNLSPCSCVRNNEEGRHLPVFATRILVGVQGDGREQWRRTLSSDTLLASVETRTCFQGFAGEAGDRRRAGIVDEEDERGEDGKR